MFGFWRIDIIIVSITKHISRTNEEKEIFTSVEVD